MYRHGENRRTWPQSKTLDPATGPASKMIGSSPCASRCAAAARPTGPAPITATGRGESKSNATAMTNPFSLLTFNLVDISSIIDDIRCNGPQWFLMDWHLLAGLRVENAPGSFRQC